MEEMAIEEGRRVGVYGARSEAVPAKLTQISKVARIKENSRMSLGMTEVDRVVGGMVPGEVILLAGEPGIGKSTLLLQIALDLSRSYSVMYVSGEESLTQLSSRRDRLGGSSRVSTKRVKKRSRSSKQDLVVTDETDVDSIVASIEIEKPELVIVDSIQAVATSDAGSYPGSITQVRECGVRLTNCAKKTGIPMILVGQVTKEGVIAGPKVLEHVVDAVVYFEGDEMGAFRLLRCLKNRFGTTDEVGIFEMSGEGLIEVDDPSRTFGTSGRLGVGSAISAVYRGSRTLFVEVQALTSSAMFGSPRRLPTGLSKQRLEMLCAVLTRRAGVSLSDEDVFVNVLGGIHLDDPSADLAVCMAIVSAKKDMALKRSQVFVGEVGLTGDIRDVAFLQRMMIEARRRKLSVVGAGGTSERNVRELVSDLFK